MINDVFFTSGMKSVLNEMDSLETEKGRTLLRTELQFFPRVKDRIIFHLVNCERNRELLERIPHIVTCGDLAVVFRVAITEDGMESIAVTDQMLFAWGTTVYKLADLAMENTPRIYPPTCYVMDFSGIKSIGLESLSRALYRDAICSLTNEQMSHGAAVMVYPKLFGHIADELNSDLIIIPSSVHEIIIMKDGGYDISGLSDLIREVNNDWHCIGPKEVLSDHPYKYAHKTQSIISLL